MNVLECGICNEAFDYCERRPRILPCSHSFCTSCLSQLINARKTTCPFCREDFKATNAEDLVFNRHVMDIAKQLADQGFSCKQEDKANVTYNSLQKDFIADTDMKLADCLRRKTILREAIESNKTLEYGLLRINKDMRSNITKYLRNQEKQSQTFLTVLRENGEIMQNQYESLFEEEEQLADISTKLSEATNFTSASSYIDKASEIGESLKDLAEKENRQILLNKTSTRGVLKVHFEAEYIAGFFQQVLERKEDDVLDLTSDSLAKMSPSLKGMIKSGMLLAFQDREGTRRYAPLRLDCGNQLCLFHLREEQQLPQDTLLIKHDHIMELLNSRPYRTFLELKNNETVLGRLVIKLDPDGFYPKNFLHMCAGTAGPCFVNTEILEVKDKFKEGERVLIGKRLAQQAAVSGVNWNQEYKKEIYRTNILTPKVGLVRGWNAPGISHLSKFFVVTKEPLLFDDSTTPCFGKLEEGLNVLTNAISQCADATQIRVINSGIIFFL